MTASRSRRLPLRGRTLAGALGAVALVAAICWTLPTRTAQADGPTCTAVVAGAQPQKKNAAELVVMNLTPAAATFDLRLRDADGNVLTERPGEVTVNARGTAAIDLFDQLARDLPNREKPYSGLVAVELVGDATLTADNFLVHVTQYFGKRKKPKGAVVLKPTFTEN